MTAPIEKIQKLLRLAAEEGGGTEAERELATQRAQDLMLKWNLDYSAIHEQSAPGHVSDYDIHVQGAMNQWKVTLVAAVGSVCFVDSVVWKLGAHHKRLMLVGRPDNLAFVRTLVDHLVPWLEEECKTAILREKTLRGDAFFNPRAFKRSFMESATWRIRGRLHQRLAASQAGTDLVVHEGAANRAYIEDKVGQLRRARSRRGSGELSGHAAGREAGARADITPGHKLGGGP